LYTYKITKGNKMTPDRKEVINTNKIEEYYWAGKTVVYVNNYLVNESFEEACKKFANKSVYPNR